MTRKQFQYDVAVIGAGMVGAALACALGRDGFRVALLEQTEAERWTLAEYDLRVSALSPATQTILRNLGVWEAIRAARISPYRAMHAWDAQGGGSIHFEAADLQLDNLGHIVENRLIQTALLDAIAGIPEIERYCPVKVTGITQHSDHALVEIDGAGGPVRLRAALVVGADGAQSQVRQQAGLQVQSWEYKQRGLVAVVATEKSHQQTAWQRFLPAGPLAFLPLQDGRSSIVWSVDENHADELLALPDAEFCRELGTAFDHCLGTVLSTGPRAAFPLQFMHARRLIAERIALVGDAAHVVHPLAGQGVNLGMLDIAELLRCLQSAREHGGDPGGTKALRRYERARKGDTLFMGLALDGINRLFTARSPALTQLRSRGLDLVDNMGMLKHFFMRAAMGTNQGVPPLAACDPSH
jgi:2-octaprenylphenol hydroxylase